MDGRLRNDALVFTLPVPYLNLTPNTPTVIIPNQGTHTSIEVAVDLEASNLSTRLY